VTELDQLGREGGLGDRALQACAALADGVRADADEASSIARQLWLRAHEWDEADERWSAVGDGSAGRAAPGWSAVGAPSEVGRDPLEAWSCGPVAVPGARLGPRLAGTEGTRPETAEGVRVAQLPDAE
jgi:hypothetical protein